ncbi:hypothetical protein DFH29DRAFT_1019768 [Suillus ampliporus]|nr:hypothetical protein DFH29DRAFT_1019768 [Suillus ampliporus]
MSTYQSSRGIPPTGTSAKLHLRQRPGPVVGVWVDMNSESLLSPLRPKSPGDVAVVEAVVSSTTTPPSRVNAAPKLKSTPNAVGSAVISEHISTVGVHVDDIRPWIARDVENFRRCGADTMLQELLHGCKDTSVPPIEKSKLFGDSLKAVERICNDEKITEHVKAFAKCTSENKFLP